MSSPTSLSTQTLPVVVVLLASALGCGSGSGTTPGSTCNNLDPSVRRLGSMFLIKQRSVRTPKHSRAGRYASVHARMRRFPQPMQTFERQNSGANCIRAQANASQRVALQFSTAGGTTNFEGVSFDGALQPISVALPLAPQTAPSELLGIHFQLDKADTTAGYTVYVDDWTVYSW